MIDNNNFLILPKIYHENSVVSLETTTKTKRSLLSIDSKNILVNCCVPGTVLGTKGTVAIRPKAPPHGA